MDQQPAHGFGNNEQSPRDKRLAHIGASFGQMREFRQRVHNLQMGVDANYNNTKSTIDSTNTAIKNFGKFEEFLIDLGLNTNIPTLMNCSSEVLREMQEGGRMYTQSEERDYNRHRENVLAHLEKIADFESNMRILEGEENVEMALLRQEIAVKNQKITDLEDQIKCYQYQLDRTMEFVDKSVAEKKCYCQCAWPQAVQENQQLCTSLEESMTAAKEAVERCMACLPVETQEAMKTVSTPPLLEQNNLPMDAPEEPSGIEIEDTPTSVANMLEALQLNAEESNDEMN